MPGVRIPGSYAVMSVKAASMFKERNTKPFGRTAESDDLNGLDDEVDQDPQAALDAEPVETEMLPVLDDPDLTGMPAEPAVDDPAAAPAVDELAADEPVEDDLGDDGMTDDMAPGEQSWAGNPYDEAEGVTDPADSFAMFGQDGGEQAWLDRAPDGTLTGWVRDATGQVYRYSDPQAWAIDVDDSGMAGTTPPEQAAVEPDPAAGAAPTSSAAGTSADAPDLFASMEGKSAPHR